MKKVVSIIIAIINLMCLLSITIILNINIITKYKTIDKISKKIDYLSLVNLKSSSNEIKTTYDSIYLSLQQAGLNGKQIENFYKLDYISKVTSKIIYTESNYLIYNKNVKSYTLEEIYKLSTKSINKNSMSEEDKKIIKLEAESNNSKFLTIENILRMNINNTSSKKINILRVLLSNKVKIILLSLIILFVILEFILNKEKILSYIFVPVIISGILELVFSLVLPNMLYKAFSNKFLINFMYPYVKEFTNNLLFTSLFLLLISIIYLMANESIYKEEKKNSLKPKIKVKKIIDN